MKNTTYHTVGIWQIWKPQHTTLSEYDKYENHNIPHCRNMTNMKNTTYHTVGKWQIWKTQHTTLSEYDKYENHNIPHCRNMTNMKNTTYHTVGIWQIWKTQHTTLSEYDKYENHNIPHCRNMTNMKNTKLWLSDMQNTTIVWLCDIKKKEKKSTIYNVTDYDNVAVIHGACISTYVLAVIFFAWKFVIFINFPKCWNIWTEWQIMCNC
jgi:hypothetical protein